MYSLAARQNLPIQVKNESMSLWYDVKSKIASLMDDLKQEVQNKMMKNQPVN